MQHFSQSVTSCGSFPFKDFLRIAQLEQSSDSPNPSSLHDASAATPLSAASPQHSTTNSHDVAARGCRPELIAPTNGILSGKKNHTQFLKLLEDFQHLEFGLPPHLKI